MELEKRTSSFKISENLLDKLQLISKMKKTTMSEIIENLVRDYVIINKVELNEYVSKMNFNE